jgi:hypothetical protein
MHFYPVDIYILVPCVPQDWNIALCVDRRCSTLLVFSLVKHYSCKETEAPPCLRDRARTSEISDAHIQPIQRVTFNLDCNRVWQKIGKVTGYR